MHTTLIIALSHAAVAFAPRQAEEGPTEFQRQKALFEQHCAKCHTIGRGDRVGPDLRNVTKRRDRAWLEGFIRMPSQYLDSDPVASKLLEKYKGVRMVDLGLSPSQVAQLLSYIEVAGEEPISEEDLSGMMISKKIRGPDDGLGPRIYELGILSILLLFGGCLWRFDARAFSLSVLVCSVAYAYWIFGGSKYHYWSGVQQGYEPAQPIAFSHRVHAGDLGIACLYCHSGAEKSPVAGVPPVNVCMNCHNVVKTGLNTQQPSAELEKLFARWEARNSESARSIEWVRIHDLPDHVSFNHEAHVRNNIYCQECHGPVETMDRVRQVSSLSMGWCVNCHRKAEGNAPLHWERPNGSVDCVTCHK